MRVLHVLHTSLPFICGYSIRSDYILRYQREEGLDLAVVTSAQHPNGADAEEEFGGIPHFRTPQPRGKLPPGLREITTMRLLRKRLEGVVNEWRPDLIHAHSPMLVGAPALAAARRHGVPFVYEVRDLWENASVDRGKFSERSALYRLARGLETRVLARADAVVTICEKLRDELAPRTAHPDRLYVVGNGVDASSFRPGRSGEEARRRWGLGDRRLIGYIGTFQPYEGLDTLIAALPAILQHVPAAHLVITGSGGQEPELRAQVAAAGLGAHVTFTGRLPHDEVREVYAAADVMDYPRILTRTTALTTPLKPLEAMAMGKPVIVSDVPAMHELVRPGRTGLLFRAGDSGDLAARCAQLLSRPEERASLGSCAREWILSERQWPNLVRRYGAVYQSARC